VDVEGADSADTVRKKKSEEKKIVRKKIRMLGIDNTHACMHAYTHINTELT
jgi:hypothetical protein